jgi:acetolactate synthase-1/3 small subunit
MNCANIDRLRHVKLESAMRHIISILLQNEAGALSRVSNLFSSRGYNIESLNVAPTTDPLISRLTLVTAGSEEVIDQICKQLGKVVDVVAITDLTSFDHIEREFALVKVHLNGTLPEVLKQAISGFSARILDDNAGHYTIECIGGSQEIDRFIEQVRTTGEMTTVVRSGAMAIARGAPVFGRA